MKKRSFFSTALVVIILQSLTIQADGYFTSLGRGMESIVSGKPCRPEDKKTVQKTCGVIAGIGLGALGTYIIINKLYKEHQRLQKEAGKKQFKEFSDSFVKKYQAFTKKYDEITKQRSS